MSTGQLIRVILVTICSVLLASGCARAQHFVEVGGERFSVELAETREKQALGLMYRREMPRDHGMLFVFGGEAPRSFWMKNTRIPLDIMYFSKALELINVQTAQPCRTEQCPGYPSLAPAMYVLELNAGMASELGLEPGDAMTLDLASD